ncbi:hypothetical protein C2S52_013374 [Perilla frutescens var. hirtella]|nr:hypothetical protein C2S52_013374 [Perilla frutescens var. hirtella]
MALNWVLSFASTILVDGIKACKAEAAKEELKKEVVNGGFQMPVHYPRYVRSDYEKMEEWQLDLLLRQYGLNYKGDLEEMRKFAMGAFLWPDH